MGGKGSGWRGSEATRFWRFVEKTDACWIWTGARKPQGYGVFHRQDGRTSAAHRVAYELSYGALSNSKTLVCHRCDNPPCVNPAHLFAGTHLDNLNDMIAKGRARFPKKGTLIHPPPLRKLGTHCPHGHAYTPDNIRTRSDGRHTCWTCHRERRRAYRHARRIHKHEESLPCKTA